MQRQSSGLERALSHVRRFWYVPLTGLLIGGMLGFVTSRGTGATAVTEVRLQGDPDVAVVSESFRLGLADLGPTAAEIELLIEGGDIAQAAHLDLDDEQFEINVGTDPETLRMVATGESESQVRTITQTFVNAIVQLRVDRATAVAESLRTEAAQAAERIGSLTAPHESSEPGPVFVDSTDAVVEIARLDALERAAARLLEFDGGVVSATDYTSSGWLVKALLLGLSLAALGIVGVLTFAPLGNSLRSLGDVEGLAAGHSYPIFEHSMSGSGEWVLHRLLNRLGREGTTVWVATIGSVGQDALTSLRASAEGTPASVLELDSITTEMSDAPSGDSVVVIAAERGRSSSRDLVAADRQLRSAGMTIGGIALVT